MNQKRYDLIEKIGEGGIGEVYKGFDNQLKRKVAIKRMLTVDSEKENKDSDDSDNDNGLESLLKEATILSSFQHANIVTVYDISKDEKGYFVVMEYIKGETLDEAIERGALNSRDFTGIVVQTLEGLIAAHDKGLIHRDIKPTNIMLTWTASGRFQVKILDFGLAKFTHKPSLQTMDQNNSIMGSIYFMAPEQFERKALDKKIDLYSLGCIYYYCLTRKYPFEGKSAAEIMAAHLQHDVKKLHEYRKDIPESICNWVMNLISRNPVDRPNGAKEALIDYLNRSKKQDKTIVKQQPKSDIQPPKINSSTSKLIIGSNTSSHSKLITSNVHTDTQANKLITGPQNQVVGKINTQKNSIETKNEKPINNKHSPENPYLKNKSSSVSSNKKIQNSVSDKIKQKQQKQLKHIIIISILLVGGLSALVYFFILK